ncbi:hypothetical protein F511_20251 [Dorcoceras hygrometricum]|uniref:Uncharacterized protein n=1 Tax=Dorcoceras hygrometricum TaxID=472368 RepID=A0A2Z7BJR6_9LAMI|nr:hypothetical protein F511_20251 [Dorcoceras hygrometricum]
MYSSTDHTSRSDHALYDKFDHPICSPLIRKLSTAFLKDVLHYQLTPKLILPATRTFRDLFTQLRTHGTSPTGQIEPYQSAQDALSSLRQLNILRHSQLVAPILGTARDMHSGTARSNRPDHALDILRILNSSCQAETINSLRRCINPKAAFSSHLIPKLLSAQSAALDWFTLQQQQLSSRAQHG